MQNFNQQQNNEWRKTRRKMQWLRKAFQLSLLLLLIGGLYSVAKPAFIVLLPLAFLAGNFFCGWLCPFGTIQELLGKIGSLFIKKKFTMPLSLQRYLQYFRYILAIIVLSHVMQNVVDLSAINAYKTFMRAATGTFAQVTAMTIMGSFLAVSLFFDRPFCNYFCSEGIRFGVLSLGRIVTIKRNADACIGCKKCDKVCPMNIQVSSGAQVRHAQCINCFECLATCPAAGALEYGKIKVNCGRILKLKTDSYKNPS